MRIISLLLLCIFSFTIVFDCCADDFNQVEKEKTHQVKEDCQESDCNDQDESNPLDCLCLSYNHFKIVMNEELTLNHPFELSGINDLFSDNLKLRHYSPQIFHPPLV